MIDNMKKNLIIFILSFMPLLVMAQKEYKLVEQSAKERPNWVSSSDPYLFIEYKAVSLDTAKMIILGKLKNQIASSVATEICSTIVIDEEDDGEYRRRVKSVVEAKVPKMPVLQGVDLNKADIYWERYYNKKTKEYSYDYYVLYPFTLIDLQELMDAYNAYEKAVDDKIENFRKSLDNIDDVETLMENDSQMRAMKEEFKDDQTRVSQLNHTIEMYEQTIKDVHVKILESNRNTIVMQLMHGERVMKTKSTPKFRSGCAKDFASRHEGDKIVVTFDDFECYEQDDNYVEVWFRFGKVSLKEKVRINM